MKHSQLTQVLLILFTALFLSSCCTRIDKTALTIKGEYVFNNDFRMDGQYVLEEESTKTSFFFMYLFQNGYLFKAAYTKPFPEDNLCPLIYESDRNHTYYWGCFTVNGSELYIQSYFPKNELDRKIEHFWGQIENDTTIRLYKQMDDRKKVKKINQLYRFRQCDNKPDSTNILMTF